MKRLVTAVLAAGAAALSSFVPGGLAGAQDLTEWQPSCICKSTIPGRTDIRAVFEITDENAEELRRKMSQGRLGLREYATLKGGVCSRPKLCGRSYDFKAKTWHPNEPISGPVTIRINMMSNAPVRRERGARRYSLRQERFQVGRRFTIGGKPLDPTNARRSAAMARKAAAINTRVTTWRPACICRRTRPGRDYVVAVFRVTDENAEEMRQKMSKGYMGLGATARFVGPACTSQTLCGRSYDFKTKTRYPNVPIAGPVQVRINMMINAPVKRNKETRIYEFQPQRFNVGKTFRIGGQPSQPLPPLPGAGGGGGESAGGGSEGADEAPSN